jgi:peptide/nickel transport system permease protein
MLLLISIISFIAIHSAPNSFFSAGTLNPNMDEAAIAQLKSVYGIDKALHVQFTDWIKNILTLNFGVSFVTGDSVSSEILKRVPITLIINITSLILVFVISIYLGVKAALHYETKKDKIIKEISLASFAMPSFYLALILILIFSMELELFPIAGVHSLEEKIGFEYYLDMLWHLFLPIIVMVFGGIGSLTLYIRSLTIDILKSDYYFFALSRGLSTKILLYRYILPNLFPPVITLLGLSLPGLIGGSVILESIFAIDGMGQLFYLSALSRDYPVIMGILIITAFLTLLGNLLADLVLLKLNPHISQ